VHAGGDTVQFLAVPPTALLGAAAADFLPPADLRRLQRLLHSGRSMVRPVWAFDMAIDLGTADVIAHLSSGLLVLEFETRHMLVDDAIGLVQSMIRHVQEPRSLLEFYNAIATEVCDVTGFDHVVVCRFAPDDSGEAVGEARRNQDIDSFLGFNFPAADVPEKARASFLANWSRYAPDARHAPAKIYSWDGRQLDLGHSVLRSISSRDRQYLANMGIVASLVLSVILHGRLWGLIVCHHKAPRCVPHRLRDVLELFAEMASSHLEMKLIEAELEAQLHTTRIHEELVERMSLKPDLADGLIHGHPNLLDLIAANGAGLWVDGRFSAIGTTPALDQVEALVNWLNATVKSGIFHTDCLPARFPPARDFPEIASGLLALSVSRTPRDYVFWFRPEINHTVSWASGREEFAEVRSVGTSLTPRSSFAAWQETVRLHSSGWVPVELRAARRLRLSLLEVVLRRIDQTSREQEAARQQQETMALELDARLEELQATAEALQQETERRAVAEAELSQVLRRTVSDQEAERLRIARELHDTLGQSLTLLQLGLEGIGRANLGTADFQQRLTALKTLAVEFGRDINRLAWEIRPTALDDLPIQTAVKNLLEAWSDRSTIQFDLHLTLGNKRLSPDVETTLYRVLQEALTNVVRHAEATRVGVVLGATDALVTMIVDDDGRGFSTSDASVDASPAKRLGLLGIRERLSLLNGSLEVESAIGRGTTLFIRIPL
jgi:two-component system, chemotaxis family, sensor kinase Cph1